ncbi:hypothetical protein FACS1894188_07610 [Clostridia bacterium]|nr:hypothetical protein FACS1894188_07610 [Clostridia bacterium]
MKIRALELHIYSNPLFRGCSNGGISENFETILVEHPRGNIQVDTDNPPFNLCRIVTRSIGCRVYKHIEPCVPTKEGCVGYMSGGSFASSSDARFFEISDYPLAIHDRQETAEQYEQMSH